MIPTMIVGLSSLLLLIVLVFFAGRETHKYKMILLSRKKVEKQRIKATVPAPLAEHENEQEI